MKSVNVPPMSTATRMPIARSSFRRARLQSEVRVHRRLRIELVAVLGAHERAPVGRCIRPFGDDQRRLPIRRELTAQGLRRLELELEGLWVEHDAVVFP